jgi:hypothetical protein
MPYNIFYEMTANVTTLYQFCDGMYIQGILKNETFENLLEAIKNYDCGRKGDTNKLDFEIPEFTILSQEMMDYLDKKAYVLDSIGVFTKSKMLRVLFHKNVSGYEAAAVLGISQKIQNSEDYSNSLNDQDIVLTGTETFVKKANMKNGFFWLNNLSKNPFTYSSEITVNVVWHCSDINLTVNMGEATKAPINPLTLEEVREISRFLC